MDYSDIRAKKRPAVRVAYCRNCDKGIKKGEIMIALYSFRNRGQNIYICLDCAKEIGRLGSELHS